MLPFRILPALAAITLFAANISCSELGPCQGDVLRIVPSSPDSATIRVGTSVTVSAGEAYNSCASAPAHRYNWSSSDDAVVSVVPLDAEHARVTGVRAGAATITPAYAAGGSRLSGVHVTVTP